MTKEHEEHLFNEYPLLYAGRGLPPTQSLLCFGMECGDGWFDLIDKLSAKIEAYNNKLDNLQGLVQALQVKQKYGTLRFYVNGAPEEVFNWIHEAEDASGTICEQCSAPGESMTINGWVFTLCPECRKKRSSLRQ